MLAALSLAAPASPAPIEDKRLRGVHTWAMAIGTGALANVMRRPGAFDLVVVDGEEIRRAQVLKLRRHGTLVLGYLSVGTIESYRWWHSAADPYKLELWGDWGEWYADVSRLGFRDLIANRVAPGMLNKGLTGLFLDNTDMVETHAAQRPGMQRLVRRLARLVHSRNRLLFTQNGQSSLGTTLRYYDGWNREDVTYSYDFDTDRYVRVGAAERRLRAGSRAEDPGPRPPRHDDRLPALGTPRSDRGSAPKCVSRRRLALREQHRADPRSAARRLLSGTFRNLP